MKLTCDRFDFVNGKVTTVERHLPDKVPSTPLLEILTRKERAKKARDK